MNRLCQYRFSGSQELSACAIFEIGCNLVRSGHSVTAMDGEVDISSFMCCRRFCS